MPRSGHSACKSSRSCIVQTGVDEAHAAGIRAAVHATELETARAAVRAGADILVHGVSDRDVDDEFIALLKQRDVLYITTVVVMERYRQVLDGSAVGLTSAEFRHPTSVYLCARLLTQQRVLRWATRLRASSERLHSTDLRDVPPCGTGTPGIPRNH
jgi:hypothetical protein